MAHDLGLLLDAVSRERPPRLEAIGITAERVAAQDEAEARLVLPDMRHLVDEQRLIVEIGGAEAGSIARARRVEIDVSARRHDDIARLQRPPAASPDAHCVERYGRAEDALRQRAFGRRQCAVML